MGVVEEVENEVVVVEAVVVVEVVEVVVWRQLSPISFCCSADEKSLRTKQITTAYSSPSQKPPSHPS